MAVVPSTAKGRVRRRLRPRFRPPRFALDATRATFMLAAASSIAWAPDLWLRGALLGAALLVTYFAGCRDGRRDMALDLLRSGRDDRRPRTTSSDGPGA